MFQNVFQLVGNDKNSRNIVLEAAIRLINTIYSEKREDILTKIFSTHPVLAYHTYIKNLNKIKSAERQNKKYSALVNEITADIRMLENEVTLIQNSTSWKVTGPLREFMKRVTLITDKYIKRSSDSVT